MTRDTVGRVPGLLKGFDLSGSCLGQDMGMLVATFDLGEYKKLNILNQCTLG